MRSAARFDDFIPGFLLVVGDAAEIAPPAASDVEVYRTEPDAIDTSPRPITALVLDTRSHPLEALTAARRRPWLADVPVVALVAPGSDLDAVAEALDADDVLEADGSAPTMRRRIALALALGRARLGLSFAEQALEHSVSALSISDVTLPDHPLVHVTRVFEQLTGYTPSQALGRNCRFLQSDDTDLEAVEAMRDAVAARRRVSVVVRNVRRDGTGFWNEVTVFPVVAQGVSLRWMGGLQHDVTSLVEAETKAEALARLLADRQRFVHAVLDGIDVGIVTSDRHGTVTFVNRSAAAAIGDAYLHVGRDVGAVLGLEHPPARLVGDAGSVVVEHRLAAPHGDVELELTVSHGDGSTTDDEGHFFIFRDLGPEKIRERERQRLERLAAMGTMVAGFAHEVRNPVAALRSLAESLAEDLEEVPLRMPQIGRMKDVLDRVERLVRTSLQFGRPDPPTFAAYRPWEIASQALAAMGPRTRAMGGAIRIDIEADLPDVVVDRAQIIQALVVILDNALDATEAPGHVMLRATCHEAPPSSGPASAERRRASTADVRFEVTDTGPGINAEIMEHIFDPFFTTKASGTGLGLSIAQQLVSDNQGRLEVSSARGGPTSFVLVFPARVASEPITQRPTLAAPEPIGSRPGAG